MIRGLYSAATGMLAQQHVQEAVANNIANLDTPGYKQDIPTFQSIQEMALSRTGRNGSTPVGNLGLGAAYAGSFKDVAVGSLKVTGDPHHVAIKSSGYFALQTPNGERYTRDGQFVLQIDPQNKSAAYLADPSGNRVLGTNGPINVSGIKNLIINPIGELYGDEKLLGKLKIVQIPAGSLAKEGANMFSSRSQPTTIDKPDLAQGYVELSNVSPVGSMVRMIAVQRAYDAAQKAVTTQDETLGKAVNEVARA